MTAIVAGQGLGLTNTSLGLLGSRGQLGVAEQGRSGEKVAVNASNGNLIVQQQDEWLVGVGPDVGLLRTYNSQATEDGDNNDNWRLGFSRKVLGTYSGSAGSTVQRIGEDGSTTTFLWDASLSAYVSKSGGGSFDTLKWNNMLSQWTWTDGDTQVTETYEASGTTGQYRLTKVADLDGKSLTLRYVGIGLPAAGLIDRITTDSTGEYVSIAYGGASGKNIQSLTTYSSANAQLLKRVSYAYDGSNRLTEVKVDLSPADGVTADNYVYVTNYTYDGSTTRLQTLTQSGQSGNTLVVNSRLEFTYFTDSTLNGRIKTITDVRGTDTSRATTFDYNLVAGTTTITDALDQVTTLTYDISTYSGANAKAGQLLSITTPAVGGVTQTTTYQYDSNGNVSSVLDARGNLTAYHYDGNGNRVFERDGQGNVVQRTYGGKNQLLSETVFTGIDPTAAGDTTLASGGLTTRYYYDAKNHLRFIVSPEGRVTQHTYNDITGQRESTLQYLDAANLPAEVVNWNQDFSAGTGGLILPAPAITRTGSGATGALTLTPNALTANGPATVSNAAAYPAGSLWHMEFSTGSTISTDLLNMGIEGGSFGQASYRRYAINLSADRIYLKAYNGAAALPVVDLGEAKKNTAYVLEIFTQADGSSTLRVYESDKEPSSGFTDVRSFTDWSTASLMVKTTKAADTASGSTIVLDNIWSKLQLTYDSLVTWADQQTASKRLRTDYAYDTRGQLNKVTTYAKVDANGAGVSDGSQNITQYVYDQSGNLLSKIVGLPGNTATTSYTYDGLNRVKTYTDGVGNTTTQVQSLTEYDDAALTTKVTLANGLVSTSTYDKGGRLLSVSQADSNPGSTTPLGTTTYTYDKLGRLVATKTPGTPSNPSGESSYILYDAIGRRVGEIDAELVLTEYIYNQGNQLVQTKRYNNKVAPAKITGDGSGLLLANVRPVPDTTNDRISRNVYDKAGRLSKTIDAIGAVVEYRYDGAGRVTDTVRYAVVLTATLLDALNQSPTELTTSNGYIAYTLVGGGSGSISLASVSNLDRRTRNFYSADGLLLGQLDAEKYYTANSYDSAGRLLKTTRYANALVGTLAEGNTAPLVVSATPQAAGTVLQDLPAAPAVSKDQVTQYLYNGRGQLVGVVDAEGYYTRYTYDTAGNKQTETRYANTAVNFDGTAAPAVVTTAPGSGPYVLTSTEDQSSAYGYDKNNRLTSIDQQPNGLSTSYTYDKVGNLIKTVRAVGVTLEERTEQRRYDVLGRLTGELTGEGSKALVALGASPTDQQIDTVWKTYGLQHSYDAAGRRIATIEPNGTDAAGLKTIYYYDKVGRLTHSINALGEVTQYSYNSFGEQSALTRVAARMGNPGGLTGGLNTALSGVPLSGTDDTTTRTGYNRLGLVERLIDAQNKTSNRYYNGFGELSAAVQYIDASTTGKTDYVYDKRGLLLTATDKLIGTTTRVTQNTYDAFGRVVTQRDGLLKDTVLAYDRLGRQVQVTDRSGVASTTTYDAFGRTLIITDGLGNQTKYTYDSANRKVTLTTPENIKTITESNRHGQAVKVTNGRSGITTFTYDADGQLKITSAPAGINTGITYDKAGRVSETTDARGTVTRITYDKANRVATRVVDPSGLNLTTSYTYDAKGQVLWVKDAKGVWTSTEYELTGQVKAVVVDPKKNPDWVSGGDNNPDGLALRTEYTYDGRGKTLTVVEGAGTTQAKTTKYVYDLAGRRTSEIVDPDGTLQLTTTYTYDANDNVVARTDANNQVTRYVYDGENRQIYSVDATGAVVKTEYDQEGRVSRTTAYAAPISLSGLGLAITAADITTTRLVPNDAADHASINIYDKDGRLSITLDALGYATKREYDAIGDVTMVTRYATKAGTPGIAKQTGNLISFSTPTITADAVNDQVDQTVYDSAGRPTWSIDAKGYATQRDYDGNGNVIRTVRYANPLVFVTSGQTLINKNNAPIVGSSATAGASTIAADANKDQITTYTYDKAGRLTQSIVDPYTSGVNNDATHLNLITSTVYDAVGNAILRTDTAGNSTRYIYDAAGRQIYMADATGSVTKTTYEGTRVIQTSHHASAVAADNAMRIGAQANSSARVNIGGFNAGDVITATVAFKANAYTKAQLSIGYGTTYLASANQYGARSSNDGWQTLTVTWTVQPGNPALSVYLHGDTGDYAGNSADHKILYDNLLVTKQGTATPIWSDDFSSTALVWADGGQYNISGGPVVQDRYISYSTSSLSDAALAAKVTDANRDQLTRYSYDAAGRLIEEIHASGQPEQASTRYVLDKLGQRIKVIDPRGVEAAEGTSEWAAAERARILGGIAASWATPPSKSTDPASNYQKLLAAYTTQQEFDANGRITKTVDPLTHATLTEYDAFGNAVKVTDPNGNAGYFYFDKLNQATWSIDPMRYAVQTEFDAFGQATRITRYMTPVAVTGAGVLNASTKLVAYDTAAAASAAGALVYMLRASKDQLTQIEHDKLGRQTKITDAEGFFESMTYDGLGNKETYTKKSSTSAVDGPAGTYIYTHDRLGRVLTETMPEKSAGQAVRTAYVYDAQGNITQKTEAQGLPEERITRFKYDALNRQVERTDASRSVYPGTGSVISNAAPKETRTYDARGNLIEVKAPDGGRTLTYWDANNRKVAEINPVGTLTVYDHDKAGNLVSQRIYGDAVPMPGVAGGTTPQPVNAANVRETQYTIDASNRASKITVKNVTVGQRDPVTLAYAASDTDVVTQVEYNSNGKPVKETDARGSVNYNYYDKLGRKVLQVNAERYAIAWEYSGTGNVTKETRFDKAIPLSTVVTTGASVTDLLNAIPPGDSTRITVIDYDKLGRVKLEQRLDASWTTVDAATGVATTTTGQPVTTTYEYNGLGQITVKIDSDGGRTDKTYDTQGRLTKTQSPTGSFAVSKGVYADVRPVTDIEYNGLDLAVKVIERDTAGTLGGGDHVVSHTYSKGLLTSTLANGITTNFLYDAMGRQTRQSVVRYDFDNTATTAVTDYVDMQYDAMGHETQRRTYAIGLNDQTAAHISESTAEIAYNAYGQISAKGTNGVWHDRIDYDAAGRVWRTNSGTDKGQVKVYYYDTNGNATLELTSVTEDLFSNAVLAGTKASTLTALLNTGKVYPKFNVYDKLNQLVETYAPPPDTSSTGPFQGVSIDFTGGTFGATFSVHGSYQSGYLMLSYFDGIFTLPDTRCLGAGKWQLDYRINYTGPGTASPTTTTVFGSIDSPTLSLPTGGVLPSLIPYISYTATLYRHIDGVGKILIGTRTFQADNSTPSTTIGQTLHFKGLPVRTEVLKFSYRAAGTNDFWTTNNLMRFTAEGIATDSWHSFDWVTLGLSGNFEYKLEALDSNNKKLAGASGTMTLGNSPVLSSLVMDAIAETPPSNASYLASGTAAAAFGKSLLGKQTYDAFGQVISATDALNHTTKFKYDKLGRLIEKRDPLVDVTLENGFVLKNFEPVTTYEYDSMGRLTRVQDANGTTRFATTTIGDQSVVLAEFHTDGGIKRNGYSVFGDLVYVKDEIARETWSTYDKDHQLTAIDRPGAGDEEYKYDSQGNRIGTLLAPDANLQRQWVKTYYDTQGRITATVSAGGMRTDYSYNWIAASKAWRTSTTIAGLGTSYDDVDAFGRSLWHKDYGDHAFTYRYNAAGLLVGQTSLASDVAPSGLLPAVAATLVKTGQDLQFTYYANGLLKDNIDNAMQVVSHFGYDLKGNKISEGQARAIGATSVATATHWEYLQNSVAQYDAAGRITNVKDLRSEVSYEYDKLGNRRMVSAKFVDLASKTTKTKEDWYTYDSMNRMTMSQGVLSTGVRGTSSGASGTIAKGTSGIKLEYDAASQRTYALYGYDNHGEKYDYNADGYLSDVYLDTIDTNGNISSHQINVHKGYDARGNVMLMESYGFGPSSDYIMSGDQYPLYWHVIDRRERTYDNDGKVLTETAGHDLVTYAHAGGPPDPILGWSMYLDYSWAEVSRDTYHQNNMSFHYLASGELEWYTSGSQASGTTTTTSYTYEVWDFRKTSTIKAQAANQQAPGWAPGLSNFTYDKNGHLASVTDMARPGGARTLTYTSDAEGHVLQRIDAAPGQTTLIYTNQFFNGRQIGTVTNDPMVVRPDYGQIYAIQNSGKKVTGRDPVSTADFDQNYQTINANYPGLNPDIYTVAKTGEKLQQIAQAKWGDSSLWYLIADANGLKDTDELVQGQQLVLPNKVTNIHNTSQTTRPYDVASALGNVDPTLPTPPPPPKKKWSLLFKIFAVIVIAVVAYFTWTTGVSAAIAFLAGAAASVVIQEMAILQGYQDKISWKAAAIAGISMAVGQGMNAWLQGAAWYQTASAGYQYAAQVATAAASNAVSQGVAVALDLQDSFSWRSVAAAGLGAGASIGAGQAMNAAFGSAMSTGIGTFAGNVVKGIASGWASAIAHREKPNWGEIAAQSFGTALGDSIAGSIQQADLKLQAQRDERYGLASGSGLPGLKFRPGTSGGYGGQLTNTAYAEFSAAADAAIADGASRLAGEDWMADVRARKEQTEAAALDRRDQVLNSIVASVMAKDAAREAALARQAAAQASARNKADANIRFLGAHQSTNRSGLLDGIGFTEQAMAQGSIFGTPLPVKVGNGGRLVSNPDFPRSAVPLVVPQSEGSNFFGYTKALGSQALTNTAAWGMENRDRWFGEPVWALSTMVGGIGDVMYPGSPTEAIMSFGGGKIAAKTAPMVMGYLNKLPVLGDSMPQLGSRISGWVSQGMENLAAPRTLNSQFGGFYIGEGAANSTLPRAGFANAEEFIKFSHDVRTGLSNIGYENVEPILQGSAVTGRSFKTGQPFDVGRVSDFDIALADPALLAKAESRGIGLRAGDTRTGPLTARDLRILGLRDLSNQLTQQAGRDVNFMIYNNSATAIQRAPSIVLPRVKD